VYGPKRIAGFKEVWSTEFTPHFLQLFGPDTRIIQLVRDPRAVLVSNFFSEGRYPILFLARQWRKLAALSYAYQLKNSASVCTVRYEDLISQPENTLKQIFTFLGIEFDPAYLDTTTLRDGGNKEWLQNSTFGEKLNPGFNRASLDKWRGKIDKEVQKAIEFLTFPELLLMGYAAERFSPSDDISKILLSDDSDKLAPWIRPYSQFDDSTERARETDRLRALSQPTDASSTRQYYLLPEVYEACQNLQISQ